MRYLRLFEVFNWSWTYPLWDASTLSENICRAFVWSEKCPSEICLVGEVFVGDVSGRGSVLRGCVWPGKYPSGMCLVGEMSVGDVSGRESVHRMYLVGEMSVGEVSVGEESVGEMSVGDVSRNPLTYRQCQLKLLQEDICHLKSDIRVLKKEFNSNHSLLQHEIGFIDFAHVCSLFLRSNNRILASKSATQQKKLNKLVKSNISMGDPSKVIFNFSKYELSDCEKRLLAKGVNFSLPLKYLDYADYLVDFELFYRNIRNLGIFSNEDLDSSKTKTKEPALSSYRNYNNNAP